MFVSEDHHPVVMVENTENNQTTNQMIIDSLDWIKGKSTGNHGFYHQI